MTVTLAPTPAKLPPGVPVPANGELVDSASVIEYAQTLLNALAYDQSVTIVLTEGGTLRPSTGVDLFPATGDVSIGVQATHVVTINGFLTVDSGADGGATRVMGPGGFSVPNGPTRISHLASALGYLTTAGDSGRVPRRPFLGTNTGTAPPPSAAIVEPAVTDWLIFPVGLLSGSRHFQISDAIPTGEGDWLEIYNGDTGSNSISIYAPVSQGSGILGVAAPGKTIKVAKVINTGLWYFAGGA